MLVKGDKLIVTKRVAGFLDEGDIVEVVNVGENGLISFAFGEGLVHKGIMNKAECDEHFEKVVAKVKEKDLGEVIKIVNNLKSEIYKLEQYLELPDCSDLYDCDECPYCPCDECCDDECDECDECLDTDLDCDDCDDYDCPYNTNKY